MALNVPRLNFGVSPAMQLPNPMGELSNAILQAAQVHQQRVQRENELRMRQEQQQFQNEQTLRQGERLDQQMDLSQQRFDLAQQEAASMAKSREQQQQLTGLQIDDIERRKVQQEGQTQLWSGLKEQMASLTDPMDRNKFILEQMDLHPDLFDFKDQQEISKYMDSARFKQEALDLQKSNVADAHDYRMKSLALKQRAAALQARKLLQSSQSLSPVEGMKALTSMVKTLDGPLKETGDRLAKLKDTRLTGQKMLAKILTGPGVESMAAVAKAANMNPDTVKPFIAAFSNTKDKKTQKEIAKTFQETLFASIDQQIGELEPVYEQQKSVQQHYQELLQQRRAAIAGVDYSPATWDTKPGGFEQAVDKLVDLTGKAIDTGWKLQNRKDAAALYAARAQGAGNSAASNFIAADPMLSGAAQPQVQPLEWGSHIVQPLNISPAEQMFLNKMTPPKLPELSRPPLSELGGFGPSQATGIQIK